ncbi:hypothetical protein A9P82_01655 [Arachidicoccus ginsenosidimutans]|uniref:hypothetical protein n=1 Tax=Arachidicoccus sp. BS20 TaxID=1850526 RepID=UPI0007F1044B|nr:hypothetical protein [Arachidicoccus sp. BS20]ANI88129.1 hypothetical protein A9P82_01655 [Arachidicoccus sp. BS20]
MCLKKSSIFKCSIIAFTFFCSKTTAQKYLKKKLKIEFGTNYSVDNFKWSIAGNQQGKNPNVLSEITYKSIKRFGIAMNLHYNITNQFFFNVTLNHLYTINGQVTDIDYAGDNRTYPNSQLLFKSKKGKENMFNPYIDYLILKDKKINLVIGIGYNVTKNSYYFTSEQASDIKTIYYPTWQAAQLHTMLTSHLFNKFAIELRINESYLFYHATANWLLRTDFNHPKSFTDKAQGYGTDLDLEFKYCLFKHITINLSGIYSNWKTNAGIDVLYLSNGSNTRTKMNGAYRTVKGLFISGCYSF